MQVITQITWIESAMLILIECCTMWAGRMNTQVSRVRYDAHAHMSCNMWMWVEHLSRDHRYAMSGTTHTHQHSLSQASHNHHNQHVIEEHGSSYNTA